MNAQESAAQVKEAYSLVKGKFSTIISEQVAYYAEKLAAKPDSKSTAKNLASWAQARDVQLPSTASPEAQILANHILAFANDIESRQSAITDFAAALNGEPVRGLFSTSGMRAVSLD